MTQGLSQRRLLLISNSFCFGRGYLEHCAQYIKEFLGGVTKILFIPYALKDWDKYLATAREGFGKMGIEAIGIQSYGNPVEALGWYSVVFVGDGNTFRLLKTLYDKNMMSAINSLVASGSLSYLGASAGANIAGPTIMTTNDMPIVFPETFVGLGLIPFQINPHFIDADPTSKHMGETWEKRLAEFHEENDSTIIGMREGSWITVENGTANLHGTTGAKLFIKGQPPKEWDGQPLALWP